MDVISRKEAKAQELKYYVTGKPCKNGHISKRYVTSCHCIKCHHIQTLNWYQNNKERCHELSKNNYQNNKEKRGVSSKKWYQNNKERHKFLTKNYYKTNKDVFTLKGSKRRATKLQALPTWYTQEKDLIKKLYSKSQELSKLWNIILHVDHIVPLQGENVCGLHCWSNLQLLEGSLNRSKSNKLEENQ